MYVTSEEALKLADMFEKRFNQNDYLGDLNAKHSASYIPGNIPVIVSAPHTVKYIRKSDSSIKVPDSYTGSLALILNKLTGCHVIFAVKGGDFGNSNAAYKRCAHKLLNEIDVKCLLDLHGAKMEREFDIDLGTVDGKSIDQDTIRKMVEIFNNNGLENIYENHTFHAIRKRCVANYISQEFGIPAVQIEINSKFRDPHWNLEQFISTISSLSEIIQKASFEWKISLG